MTLAALYGRASRSSAAGGNMWLRWRATIQSAATAAATATGVAAPSTGTATAAASATAAAACRVVLPACGGARRYLHSSPSVHTALHPVLSSRPMRGSGGIRTGVLASTCDRCLTDHTARRPFSSAAERGADTTAQPHVAATATSEAAEQESSNPLLLRERLLQARQANLPVESVASQFAPDAWRVDALEAYLSCDPDPARALARFELVTLEKKYAPMGSTFAMLFRCIMRDWSPDRTALLDELRARMRAARLDPAPGSAPLRLAPKHVQDLLPLCLPRPDLAARLQRWALEDEAWAKLSPTVRTKLALASGCNPTAHLRSQLEQLRTTPLPTVVTDVEAVVAQCAQGAWSAPALREYLRCYAEMKLPADSHTALRTFQRVTAAPHGVVPTASIYAQLVCCLALDWRPEHAAALESLRAQMQAQSPPQRFTPVQVHSMRLAACKRGETAAALMRWAQEDGAWEQLEGEVRAGIEAHAAGRSRASAARALLRKPRAPRRTSTLELSLRARLVRPLTAAVVEDASSRLRHFEHMARSTGGSHPSLAQSPRLSLQPEPTFPPSPPPLAAALRSLRVRVTSLVHGPEAGVKAEEELAAAESAATASPSTVKHSVKAFVSAPAPVVDSFADAPAAPVEAEAAVETSSSSSAGASPPSPSPAPSSSARPLRALYRDLFSRSSRGAAASTSASSSASAASSSSVFGAADAARIEAAAAVVTGGNPSSWSVDALLWYLRCCALVPGSGPALRAFHLAYPSSSSPSARGAEPPAKVYAALMRAVGADWGSESATTLDALRARMLRQGLPLRFGAAPLAALVPALARHTDAARRLRNWAREDGTWDALPPEVRKQLRSATAAEGAAETELAANAAAAAAADETLRALEPVPAVSAAPVESLSPLPQQQKRPVLDVASEAAAEAQQQEEKDDESPRSRARRMAVLLEGSEATAHAAASAVAAAAVPAVVPSRPRVRSRSHAAPAVNAGASSVHDALDAVRSLRVDAVVAAAAVSARNAVATPAAQSAGASVASLPSPTPASTAASSVSPTATATRPLDDRQLLRRLRDLCSRKRPFSASEVESVAAQWRLWSPLGLDTYLRCYTRVPGASAALAAFERVTREGLEPTTKTIALLFCCLVRDWRPEHGAVLDSLRSRMQARTPPQRFLESDVFCMAPVFYLHDEAASRLAQWVIQDGVWAAEMARPSTTSAAAEPAMPEPAEAEAEAETADSLLASIDLYQLAEMDAASAAAAVAAASVPSALPSRAQRDSAVADLVASLRPVTKSSKPSRAAGVSRADRMAQLLQGTAAAAQIASVPVAKQSASAPAVSKHRTKAKPVRAMPAIKVATPTPATAASVATVSNPAPVAPSSSSPSPSALLLSQLRALQRRPDLSSASSLATSAPDSAWSIEALHVYLRCAARASDAPAALRVFRRVVVDLGHAPTPSSFVLALRALALDHAWGPSRLRAMDDLRRDMMLARAAVRFGVGHLLDLLPVLAVREETRQRLLRWAEEDCADGAASSISPELQAHLAALTRHAVPSIASTATSFARIIQLPIETVTAAQTDQAAAEPAAEPEPTSAPNRQASRISSRQSSLVKLLRAHRSSANSADSAAIERVVSRFTPRAWGLPALHAYLACYTSARGSARTLQVFERVTAEQGVEPNANTFALLMCALARDWRAQHEHELDSLRLRMHLAAPAPLRFEPAHIGLMLPMLRRHLPAAVRLHRWAQEDDAWDALSPQLRDGLLHALEQHTGDGAFEPHIDDLQADADNDNAVSSVDSNGIHSDAEAATSSLASLRELLSLASSNPSAATAARHAASPQPRA